MSTLLVRIQKEFPPKESRGFSVRGFHVDVAFDAPPGITLLFGPSGSGKTTILDCIAGVLRPDEEEISVGHNRLSGRTPQQRNIGYVFQTLALFPHMTARQNVEYGLHGLLPAVRTSRCAEAMERFHISNIANQRPDEISGGERQRVALARAVVTQPAALLLDEPLSALDYQIKSHIIADLLAWNEKQQIPIIYVTHALDEAFALGDRVLVIREGKLIKQGTPMEVLSEERDRLIRQLQPPPVQASR